MSTALFSGNNIHEKLNKEETVVSMGILCSQDTSVNVLKDIKKAVKIEDNQDMFHTYLNGNGVCHVIFFDLNSTQEDILLEDADNNAKIKYAPKNFRDDLRAAGYEKL